MNDPEHDITVLLNDAAAGGRGAQDRLFAAVYSELKQVAAAQLRREGRLHGAQATSIVHEAYFRLFSKEGTDWPSRRYFFGAAAKAMRRILIERARHDHAAKRGGGWKRVSIESAEAGAKMPEEMDHERLDKALSELSKKSARAAEVVELRFYLGLEFAAIAAALGCSERTVHGDWAMARAWLYERLEKEGE